jgi:hypothetical protein
VRWPAADPLFETTLPITVETDIYPADWTVVVRDEEGTVVRTFSGYTTNSQILTNWDGLTQSATNAPDLAAYEIEVSVDSGSSMMSMMSSTEGDGFSFQGKEVNKYGVTERIYIKQVVAPGHYREVELTETWFNPKTGEFEVIKPAKTEYIPEKTTMLTNRIPVLDSGSEKSESPAMMAVGASGSGSVLAPVWKERARSSGEIILARQKYKGTGLFPTLSARYLFNNKLQTWMGTDLLDAFINSSLPTSRGVYGGAVTELANTGDYPALLTALADPAVSALYYHGHSDGERVGFSEYLTGEGFRAKDLSTALQNYVIPGFSNRIPTKYRFNQSFNFVFMDSCLSANGGFPHAFGIPKDLPQSFYSNKKKRAFLGWTVNSRNYLVQDDDQFDWTKEFFAEWLAGGDGSVTLESAFIQASQAVTGATNGIFRTYGTTQLKWAD